MHGPDPAAARRATRAILALTVAAFLVRAAFLLCEPATHPVGDERTWTNWATENLVTPKVRFSPLRTHMVFYPPLYPYFIALPYELWGSLTAVKWLQAGVGSLVVPALGLLGLRLFGPAAGVATAAIAAFYPEFVWFSVHFWSETLFLVFLWWALERVLSADESGRVATAAGAGVLWGLGVLTRETTLYFVPLAAAFLAWRGGRARLALGSAFLATALATVAPWTLRNWVVFHAFVPVSTAGGLNLYQGNARLTRQEVYDRYEAVNGRIEQYRFARQAGIEAILERQPWWFFEKLRDEMPNFWEADSLALIHIKRGAYGPVSPGAARGAAAVVLLPYLALLALFVASLARVPLERGPVLLLVFLVYYDLLHVATHGFARYRLPALPVLFLLGGWFLSSWRAGTLPAASRARTVAAVVVAAGLAVTLGPSIRKNVQHPAFGLAERTEDGEASSAGEP